MYAVIRFLCFGSGIAGFLQYRTRLQFLSGLSAQGPASAVRAPVKLGRVVLKLASVLDCQ